MKFYRIACAAILRIPGSLMLAGGMMMAAPTLRAERYEVVESMDVGRVVSDFRVKFSLLTDVERKSQYAAYYDDQRRMTVAMRSLDSKKWQYQTLPTEVGWDSHNYVTMALDSMGNLHVAGNMHNVPLVYFVTSTPGDITSLKSGVMTGEREERVTYPKFMTNHLGELVFNYRDGGSGNGVRFYNKLDSETGTWMRLLDTPLLDGEGKRNAYPVGPVRGPDGWFHMIWVWRMTPDCATNHHLSYARSRDLIEWESSNGRKVGLPITFDEDFLLIDPIPVGGGIINGGAKISFDEQDRPLVTYHKSDEKGHMQVYVTRPDEKGWVIRQLTQWNEPIKFSGRGSMGFIGIKVGKADEVVPGVMRVSYQHRDHGNGRLFFDEQSLEPLEEEFPVEDDFPNSLGKLESDFPGMKVRQTDDMGDAGEDGVRYLLKWESLGPNRDKVRKPPFPEPSMLRLYKLVE